MLAFDHQPPMHPWQGSSNNTSQLPLESSDACLDSALALAALSQGANPTGMASLDALQAMLLSAQHNQQHAQHLGQLSSPHGGVAGASNPDLSQLLLSQLQAPPGLAAHNSLPGSSSPLQQQHHHHQQQHFDAAADAWASASNHHHHSSGGGSSSPQGSSNTRVFVPESLKSTLAVPGSSPPAHDQFLLQAALNQQHAAGMHSPSTDNLLPLVQEQLLLQALQQQQQSASQASLQQALAAALSAAGGSPPGLAGAQQLPLGSSNNSSWPLLPPGLDPTAATAAAATAAALLAAQQQQLQQQQVVLTQALASAGLLGGLPTTNNLLQQLLLSQQQQPNGSLAAGASPAAAGVINQLQPWAIKALATQMQQQGGAGMGLGTALNQQLALAGLLNTTNSSSSQPIATSPLPRHGGSQSGSLARRSRNSRRSSGTTAPDLSGFSGFAAASRAGSITGSDVSALAGGDSKGLPAVLPAGVSASDLCPTKYEDNWGSSSADAGEPSAAAAAATTTPTNNAVSVSSDGSMRLARNGSCASSSSIESPSSASLCGSVNSLSSSSASSSASQVVTAAGGGSSGEQEDRWQWDSHFCSLDEGAVEGASGVAGRACRRAQKGTAASASQHADDTKANKDQAPLPAAAGSSSNKAAAAGDAPCPVWIPGEREAAGDDSWYLPRPPTCRLFVGNIGCWVDEAMLLGYFGKYGHVVDVQVMWNTKMLARGRRVNREFAFISYSSPLEAARAVHWLDGCRLPDLEKDKNGVTVEYENGEGESPAGAGKQ